MSENTLRLLLIEDNLGDARFIREMLGEATELGERTLGRTRDGDVDWTPEDDGDPSLTMVHEPRLSSGLERLGEDGIDVVLLDLNLPDSDGLETLSAVRGVSNAVPIIVLTGVRDRETGMEAFNRGADEYLVKDQISSDLLIRSIYHAIVHKRDERELRRQRDRLQAKTERLDEFAGIVAHDLRNPLSVAAGALELARETDDEENLDRVADALDRMDRLIDDLLTLARQGDHVEEPQPVRLESAVRDAWTYVATEGATLDASGLAGADPLLADPDRLAQLLENLFGNAVDHGRTAARTPAGDGARTRSAESEVESDGEGATADARHAPIHDEDLERGEADLTVRVGELPSGFYVEDTGPGIPPDERDRVFEAGYTTDRSGTGFGLSIVREIAGAHGWEVAVVEGTDGGARFEFTGVEYV